MARGRPKGSKGVWSRRMIADVKASIKDHLDGKSFATSKDRLQYILEQIRAKETSLDQEDQLSAYVWIIHGFLHHQRFGGMRESQVRKLVQRAKGLLQVREIKQSSQRLSHLHGDLRLAMSQIYRTQGDHFDAAWEHQMAARLVGDDEARGSEFQAMGRAVRALRLGNVEQAEADYTFVCESSSNQSQIHRAELGLIKISRLQGAYDRAATRIDKLIGKSSEASVRLEAIWEGYCLQVLTSGDLTAMIKACDLRGSHHQSLYILECFLWCRAVREKHWSDRLPSLETVRRRKELSLAGVGYLQKFVTTIEMVYNTEYPMDYRLDELGLALQNRREFLSIDLEYLGLCVAWRWLVRSHAVGLGSLVSREISALENRFGGFVPETLRGESGNLDDGAKPGLQPA